ncbi:universal stress protein [Sphaerisporangium sp. TRM90804]|uniref:universal stress protein n=1 Tax=Sphaerisporangium sp. TRM90804 TaxID=3031113 RepID=UPI00244983FC|nr:universal stress protein [Sphaerisporangium sp. TRM90804]MDH2430815.1 universal stress protein [Sphaerisporangium sp. TRM90804]
MIIVGVDGSEAALEAARWAAREAVLHGTSLHVVHAMPAWACDPHDGPYTEVAQWMRDGADSLLEEAVNQALRAEPGVEVTRARLPSDPRPALIRAAKDAELLVVGNHGLGGFRGLLLGSVALGVSGFAPCPVAVVRGPAPSARSHIVLGVDGAESGANAVEFAFAEAERRGVELLVVHGAAEATGPQERCVPAEVIESCKDRHPGTKVIEQSVPGHPVDVLQQASEDAALLVVGSRGRGGFTGLVLGSVSHAVLHHARCPVVVVPARYGD